MPAGDLQAKSDAFAASVQRTLNRVLPGDHEVVVVQPESEPRFSVRPAGENGPGRIPLFVEGQRLASLSFTYHLTMDHRDQYLKVVSSNFALYSVLERTPLLRLDYLATANNSPTAHWQFHAHRGAFSQLLARAHVVRPRTVRTSHDLSKLHLPLGRSRFRPCLEDFLEMLIRDCGIDSRRQWKSAVEAGRREWREKQVGSVVRDAPDKAAETLKAMGWRVTPRKGYVGSDPKHLTTW
jgi:hypothetical protein